MAVLSDGSVGLVFAWGLVNPGTLHFTDIGSYLFVHTRGLPEFLLAWPIAAVMYLGAIASALWGMWNREDPRLTAGLLVLAGLSLVVFADGISRPASIIGFPVGTMFLWLVAWWVYWPLVR